MENSNPRSNLRCPHCAGPLSKEMIGSAVGGTTSAFYGFNHVMPIVGKYVKGAFPCWCTTCDSVLLCFCRIGRWCCSSPCATCFFIVPCCILVFSIATVVTG